MFKREMLFAVLSLEHIQSIRELVSFRARIPTIAQLIPHQYAAKAARTMYQFSGSRAPGGTQAPCKQVLSVYRNLTLRVALNNLYNEFSDLRRSGVGFETSVIAVYRSYRQKVGWLAEDSHSITFDHWFVVALEIETRASRLMRCAACGARNLLTKHTSASSDCVFCDLLAASARRTHQLTDSSTEPRRKAA